MISGLSYLGATTVTPENSLPSIKGEREELTDLSDQHGVDWSTLNPFVVSTYGEIWRGAKIGEELNPCAIAGRQ